MITIQGHSDDVVEIEIDGKAKEIPYDREPVVIHVSGKEAGDPDTRVVVEYIYNGTWTIGVGPGVENVPMFPCRLESADNGYSPLLTIECPEGTEVTW